LISRFEWGLVAELQAPDFEMRVAVLRKKAQATDVKLPDEILNFLANRIRTNIRKLEGAVVRVVCYAALTKHELSIGVVERLLGEILLEEGRYMTGIDAIQKKVAEHFDIGLEDMTSRRRPENISFPRQIAMFISREMTETTLTAIGQTFGGRDHATVLRACRLVKDRMEVDPNVRQVVSYLEKQLAR
jgi:chromosomal replication initiator protein